MALHVRRRSLVVLVAAIATAGCGNDADDSGSDATDTSASASANPHNDADVAFLQMMVPHHAQAIEMSDLILGADAIPADVTDLAEQVEAAQQPEIDAMSEWLEAWGEDASAMGGMAMDHPMNGMLSQDEVDAIGAATGTEAARLYLTSLEAHHEGAIQMATAEVADGQSTQVIDLAQTIVETQQAQITDIERLLAAL